MKHLLFYFIICTAFCSCAQTHYMTLDVRQAATVTFDSDVKKIVIVDNSFKLSDSDTISLIMDSIRPIIIGQTAQYMNEEQLFDTVEVYPYYPKPVYKYYESDNIHELPLTKEEVQDICAKMGADALVSINYIEVLWRFYKNLVFTRDKNLVCAAHVFAQAYSNDGEPLSDRIWIFNRTDRKTDSSWNEYIEYHKENAMWIADKLVDHLIPKWQTVWRFYYTNSPAESKQIDSFISSNNWTEALVFWTEAYNNEKNKNKKKIRYASNIALAYENLDDMENAAKWINIAHSLLKDKNTVMAYQIIDYRRYITQRVKDTPVLKRQLRLDEYSYYENME